MADKFIRKINSEICKIISRLTIMVKTPIIDFSYAPMIFI